MLDVSPEFKHVNGNPYEFFERDSPFLNTSSNSKLLFDVLDGKIRYLYEEDGNSPTTNSRDLPEDRRSLIYKSRKEMYRDSLGNSIILPSSKKIFSKILLILGYFDQSF